MIIFMGVAGAGKSVQGRLLADELGLPWLSTGEFLRMLISGEHRKEMVAGKLLEDAEIIALVQKAFSLVDTDQEFVLDGFPRTVGQAAWLLSQVKYGQLKITGIVHIKASEDIVRERLLKRGRPDDYSEAIDKRFREYNDTIVPVLNQFKEANVPVYDIEGEGDVHVIHHQILQALGQA
jgi:adenylate kinase